MKKIYLIEKLKSLNGISVINVQYETFGYVTSKKKANKIVKDGKLIEKLDSFGHSYIPRQFFDEFQIKEIDSYK